MCARHGRSLDEFDTEGHFSSEQLVLASCYGASVGDRQLLGDAPGQPTRKLVRPVRLHGSKMTRASRPSRLRGQAALS
ncbi:hypothetical protein G6O69_25230 [Pseudenhygromyxa sp. WMMC2535]|uniref:hypothetical protein n=1 Tax=Pseudenhygromyxa sp. WMMC2535 TaxID=2712867 RepID=UPI00159533F4|nr:hypothetical protein [Pseudenhygromyxa sp. WMMC2535]NVB41167.1 hypothetical protein [Pseudenhygromyxa sp. WMMC2535]